MQKHKITVRPKQVSCTCGWKHLTLTGADAQREGYKHAHANGLATVVDTRLCSDRCIAEHTARLAPEGCHTVECFNFGV